MPRRAHPVRKPTPGARGGGILAFVRKFGPGVITGASDDDPSGIGTYAQTGAQFGYTQLWTALFTFPFMTAIQEICARIALETGEGLAGTLRRRFPRPLLWLCVALLTATNTVNIGADLGAMAAAGQLLWDIPFAAWLVGFTAVSVLVQVFISYHRYAKYLRFLALSLFAYVVVVFMVKQDWSKALHDTFVPTLRMDREFLLNLVAILGTTISPYLFFWQASQEVEDEIDHGRRSRASRRGVTKSELKSMRFDVVAGMLFSNLVMWFIMLTMASTLFREGHTTISSASEAAAALRPLAGRFAEAVFAAGIVGTGLLAVPVLAGSTGYAVAETFRFRSGLSLKLWQAPAFYGVIAGGCVLGAAMNLLHINPIRALYYAAMLNGLVAPVLLWLIMIVASDREIMGARVAGPLANTFGWITTLAMSAAAVALLFTLRSH